MKSQTENKNNLNVAGRWDLIPSEILDLLYESGIPRDIGCDLIESLPEDLWPQIQLATLNLDPNSAKACNCITVIVAYLMLEEFDIAEDIDIQLGTAFQYLQGKIAATRIQQDNTNLTLTRLRLDDLLKTFFQAYYQGDNMHRAANQPVH